MKYWIAFVFFLVVSRPTFATTYASNGSQSDVQTKINGASAGDTVTVPSGTFTWGAGATGIALNKAIHLTGLPGATITLSTTGPVFGSGVINMTGNGGWIDGTWTITGALNGSTAVTPITVAGTNFVITGITYNAPATNGGYFVYVSEATGVCYNCTINDTHATGTLQTFMIRGNNSRWNSPNTMGTSNAWYVEDCAIDSAYVQENDGCAASVMRFNALTYGTLDMHFIETSTSASGTAHGSRQLEGYNNIYSSTGFPQWLRAQGGTGMVFDNLVPSTVSGTHYFALLQEWGAADGIYWTGLGPDPSPNPPDPSLQVTPSKYPSGVPDQLGMGPYNPTQAEGGEPFYCFNNAHLDGTDAPIQGGAVNAANISAYGSTFYQTSEDGSPYLYLRGREYFRGIVGGTFPSTTDIGRGTRAAMLASSPTAVGQGWWETDQGSWYQKWAGAKAATAIVAGDRCQIASVGTTNFTALGASANTVGVQFISQGSGSGTGTVTPVSGRLSVWNGSSWAVYYTPYTYPHPLRSGTAPVVSSASIPSSGATMSVVYSASCTTGLGGNGGVTVTASGGAVTASYSTGSGSTTYVYNLSRTINSGETVTTSYTQPGGGIAATSDATDVASYSGQAVTNNSTQGGGGTGGSAISGKIVLTGKVLIK